MHQSCAAVAVAVCCIVAGVEAHRNCRQRTAVDRWVDELMKIGGEVCALAGLDFGVDAQQLETLQ